MSNNRDHLVERSTRGPTPHTHPHLLHDTYFLWLLEGIDNLFTLFCNFPEYCKDFLRIATYLVGCQRRVYLWQNKLAKSNKMSRPWNWRFLVRSKAFWTSLYNQLFHNDNLRKFMNINCKPLLLALYGKPHVRDITPPQSECFFESQKGEDVVGGSFRIQKFHH